MDFNILAQALASHPRAQGALQRFAGPHFPQMHANGNTGIVPPHMGGGPMIGGGILQNPTAPKPMMPMGGPMDYARKPTPLVLK